MTHPTPRERAERLDVGWCPHEDVHPRNCASSCVECIATEIEAAVAAEREDAAQRIEAEHDKLDNTDHLSQCWRSECTCAEAAALVRGGSDGENA